jgi:hypothetical protein
MICNESTKCCCTWESSTNVDGRQGCPFIAPREPLAVGSSNVKQSAFPVCVCARERTIADFLPFLVKLTVATLQPLGTPDSPMGLDDRWLGWRFGADCTADRWSGVQLVHRTVRCTLDCLVIYSRNAANYFLRAVCSPRASLGTGHCLVHTGQSDAPRVVQLLYTNLSSFGMIRST